MTIKKFPDIGILLVFCLSLLSSVVPGMAMCVGANEHAVIVSTDDHGCCFPKEQDKFSDTDLKDRCQSSTGNCCIDIPLSVEIGTRLLPLRQDEGFKSVLPCVASDIPGFIRKIQVKKLSTVCVPTNSASSLAQIRTIILLV